MPSNQEKLATEVLSSRATLGCVAFTKHRAEDWRMPVILAPEMKVRGSEVQERSRPVWDT